MSSLFSANATNLMIGIGFGTAALGNNCYDVVQMALDAGFTKFDTAEENDWWYDPESVGEALYDYYISHELHAENCEEEDACMVDCLSVNLKVSTKIPPWELTSVENIRTRAKQSREQLVGFCPDLVKMSEEDDGSTETVPYPLDVYYIHAPRCWPGWHMRCKDPPTTLDLRTAWTAMEGVIFDHSASRIGLSNVQPSELLDIIQFVQDRKAEPGLPPPRMPDVLQAFADPIHPADELRRICQEHGIEFVSYSTLGTQHGGKTNPVLTSPIVQRLAAKHNRSVAEVVLSWALQKGMSVIPRSSKKVHIDELARLLTDPTFLSESDMQEMDQLKDSI